MAAVASEHSSGAQGSPNQQPLLLVTTVDIGDGKSDRIEVRRDDIPMDVARAFVIKHGLPPAIIPRLAMHLEENLAKVAAQKQAVADADKNLGSAEGADDEEVAVFHRLYEQAIALRQKLDEKRQVVKRQEVESINANKTSMSWISSEMMRDRSSGPFGNYGEMLYAESLEAMARKKEKAERRKAEKQMEEVAGATFKPEISRVAQNLWTSHDCGSAPAWQRLSRVKMTKAQERLEMLRREKEEAEVKECTFKPQLNTRSEKLMTERSHTLRSLNVSAHQQLYQDAMRRQQKMQDYQHWYPEEVTFQPKLHESAMSREFLRKSLGPEGAAMLSASGEERHMALVNRLYASYEKLQNKLQEARSTLQTAVDPATGKKLFQPETGRAPKALRNTGHLPVGEYLYNLQEQRDEKARAVAEELERKRMEDAERAKQTEKSKALVKALQQKRFRQIFEFLDQEGLGSFNLVALMNAVPEWLDDLDDEVRADLELAAKILAKRTFKHNDSGRSEVSSIFMPPPPSAFDMADANAECSTDGASNCATPSGSPGIVNLRQFCALLEEVLSARRGPRTYLAPSPPRKYVPSETYKPQIDKRSEQLAAKVRPKDKSLYEYLYEESSVITQKKNERRAKAVAEEASSCTFAPRLVSQQLVKEGRVMRGVRDGTWYQQNVGENSELDCAASLQDLAALVSDPVEPQATAAEREAAEPIVAHSPPRSPAGAAAAAAKGYEAAFLGNAAAAQQELQALQQQLDQLEQETVEQSPVFKKQDSSRSRASRQQPTRMREEQREHGLETPPAAAVAVEEEEEIDDYEGSEEQRQYLELEREVQQMLEATSAAAAAAAHLQSHSDQQYLSEILGLAQEQVDALAPAISNLKGLEVHHSCVSSTYSEAQPGDAAAAAAGRKADSIESSPTAVATVHHTDDLMQFTPQSSFRVNPSTAGMPGLVNEESTAGTQPAAVDATAPAAVDTIGSCNRTSQLLGAIGSSNGNSSRTGQLNSMTGVISASGVKQSPRSLSCKDSQQGLTGERPQSLVASRQACIKAQLAGVSSSSLCKKQAEQQAGGMIGSRSSSKKMVDIEGMDLFELAAGLDNTSPDEINAAFKQLAM